jgi:hypothetical protein
VLFVIINILKRFRINVIKRQIHNVVRDSHSLEIIFFVFL